VAPAVTPPQGVDLFVDRKWTYWVTASGPISWPKVDPSRGRRHLVALAEKTWDLTVWLQHYADAAPADAELVLDATGYFLSTYTLVKGRQVEETPKRCPDCGSYRLEDASRLSEDGETWIEQRACARCNWEGEPVASPLTRGRNVQN
jgi:hypothetical protein